MCSALVSEEKLQKNCKKKASSVVVVRDASGNGVGSINSRPRTPYIFLFVFSAIFPHKLLKKNPEEAKIASSVVVVPAASGNGIGITSSRPRTPEIIYTSGKN